MRNSKARFAPSSGVRGEEEGDGALFRDHLRRAIRNLTGASCFRCSLWEIAPSIAARYGKSDFQSREETSTRFATPEEEGARFTRWKAIPRWKRTCDLICILITFPFWLPAMIFVLCWIKMVSPGPVVYRQERIGYKGRRFVILKFRSMRVDADTRTHEDYLTHLIRANCPMNKLDTTGDTRLIPGGRGIRALGLDELPQLLNIIRGEMSLVGPRPCTPYEFQHYQSWHRERVNALPGLTGVWQVSGKNKTTFDQMVQMDIFYTRNMSPWLDLKVIAKTVPAVMCQVAASRKTCKRPDGGDCQPISMSEPVAD